MASHSSIFWWSCVKPVTFLRAARPNWSHRWDSDEGRLTASQCISSLQSCSMSLKKVNYLRYVAGRTLSFSGIVLQDYSIGSIEDSEDNGSATGSRMSSYWAAITPGLAFPVMVIPVPGSSPNHDQRFHRCMVWLSQSENRSPLCFHRPYSNSTFNLFQVKSCFIAKYNNVPPASKSCSGSSVPARLCSRSGPMATQYKWALLSVKV